MDPASKRRRAEVNKENEGAAVNVKQGKAGGEMGRSKTIEEIYQKKTQLEHILLRPDSYVGSVEQQSQDHWVFDDASGKMTKRNLHYVPALYKIFDEILVNAADNLIRDSTQDTIRVEVRRKEGCVIVQNNGYGLPIHLHKEHNCYVPELVFGHLLTSDNYDDSEKKVVGGRNGYGAKLTNIFSTRFILETADSRSGKKYKQVWEKNMTVCNKPAISSNKAEDFTQITFYPDLKRFGMTRLDEDIAALMRRRAFDVAASTHGRCKVFLDGKQLDVESFQSYVDLHLKDEAFRTYKVINERWEVSIGLTDGSGFQQVSFVNSINTSRGGTHVNYVSDQVVNSVLDKLGKQKGGGALSVKSQHVKSYLWVFINCLVENPAFDSQTKETLTSKREKFGSDCRLPEELLAEVCESGLIETLQEWSKQMGKSELAQHLNRSDLGLQKRLFGVPKLEDANLAGTKEGHSCTLILTEGDSAKALAVAGLSVVGRDRYGVFPLRGKLRNVRELTVKQMLENREIDQVLKIMALDATKEYTDAKGLRYGSIMIMTDQDHDGSHIKGLIINFIQNWFPSLLRVPGFMKEFVTPIVKVTRGDESHTFFTLIEYNAWKEENNDGAGWKCKYYKGLGTSTGAEAKEYFADIQDHELSFTYTGPSDDDLVDMAFSSKRADDRKVWISNCEEDVCVDHSQPTLSYQDFIEKELVHFAQYDVQRAVPSMVDGLKPGQRKVLYGSFKKKIAGEIKVAQLSGYVAENSAYHHGETSLQGTIVAMAQNFVGSNNVNLLEPRGQFGSRLQGGKDHAAARYIFTRLSKVTRCVFPEADDPVLEYLNEEGMKIEPRYFAPIIPMVLVNGAEGIGTGWSTSVPNYNPRDIIANIRRLLSEQPLEPMTPWYRGFKGSVKPVEGTPGRFECTGVVQRKGRVRLEITELPVKRWTQDYKDWLVDQLPKPGAEKRAAITELREYHSENSVHFVLSMTPDKLSEAERRGFEKTFHLKSSIATSNMWMFDQEGKIKKYETPEDVITAFVPIRLEVYEKRKAHLIAKLEKELAIITNKLRFVEAVITDRLDVEKRKTKELCADMRKLGIQHMCQILGNKVLKLGSEEEAGVDGFKYLLSMKMWSLTDNKVEALRKLHADRTAELEALKGTSLEELWERDLQRLEEALDACDEEDRKEREAAAKLAAKHMGDEENVLVNKQCVLVLSRNFRAKRVRTSEWKARRRGAALSGKKGLIGGKAATKKKSGGDEEAGGGEEADDAEDGQEEEAEALAGVFVCRDFDALLVFSEHGFVYMLQALDVPLAKKMNAQGTELKEFLPELEGHRIAALVTVSQGALRDQADEFVVLVSKNGMAKKVSLDRYRGLRPGKGMPAMKLEPRDELRWAHKASKQCALVCATAEGMVNRVSLGEDWRLATAKGPGRRVMSLRGGWKDHIASSSISELLPQELQKIREKAAAKAAKAAAAGATGAEAPAKAEDEESEKEEAEEEAEKSEAEEAEEDDDDAGERPAGQPAVEEAANGAVPGGSTGEAEPADGESKASSPDTDQGQCLLVITECGFGNRIPLTCKRIGLGRKGGKGKKIIKLLDKDNLIAACVTSGRGDVAQPVKPPLAWQLYARENPEVAGAASEDTTAEAAAVQGSSENLGGEDEEAKGKNTGFAKMFAMQDKFKALPEEEQLPFLERAEEQKQRYDQELEAYRRQEVEELLLGSGSGAVSRITVGSIPVTTRLNRGKLVAKTKNGNRITTASLLSSLDDEKEDDDAATQTTEAKPSPTAAATAESAAAVVQRRLAAMRAAALRRQQKAAEGSAAAGPQNAAVETEQHTANPGTPKEQAVPVQAAPAPADSQEDESMPPLDLTPSRRGFNKQKIASTKLGKKARLSHLASPGRRQAAASSRLRPPGSPGVQMKMLKPKLRLLKPPFVQAARTIPKQILLDLDELLRLATTKPGKSGA